MDRERLTQLAGLDFSDFVQSENNVKYKIVIPFLQAFGHQDLHLEHAAQGSRIDINIHNRIIVETKALGQNLDAHIQQLADYCGREWPVLAILSNGMNFRIYSPLWKYQKTFADKIIYSFDITNLENIKLLNRLDKILSFTNYQNNEALDYIDQREKELLKVKKEIDDRRQLKTEELSGLRNELAALKEKLQELTDQIKLKEQVIGEIGMQKVPEIESLISDFFVPTTTAIPIKQPTKTGPISNNHIKGERLIINTPKNGVRALGYLLENNDFTVLQGSTISKGTAPKFRTSARKAFELRERFMGDGTINSDRQFTRDVVFNSISQAASVILGDSKNGNKEWGKEHDSH
jgi:hypothetical protein